MATHHNTDPKNSHQRFLNYLNQFSSDFYRQNFTTSAVGEPQLKLAHDKIQWQLPFENQTVPVFADMTNYERIQLSFSFKALAGDERLLQYLNVVALTDQTPLYRVMPYQKSVKFVAAGPITKIPLTNLFTQTAQLTNHLFGAILAINANNGIYVK